VESGQKDVVFHPFAFSDIMESSFLSSIEADNIQKGRSSLTGKLNTDIAARGLTITDDGILNGGIASSVSDDEGTPSQSTGIIKDGLLKSYIYDSYTAGKEERSSTGNAVRGSYTSTPSVGTRNVVFDHPASDIISEIKDGVFVTNVIGAHTANPISGDFSVEARNAFVIKDGQIEKPIKSLMVSGNIFELLRNVKGAGDDVRMVGSIITPSIWVSNMNVIG
jgi:PmbA protein